LQYLHVAMQTTSAARLLEVTPLSRLFRALGDDTRLRVVALLAHGELCVCHVQSALKLTQPNASRQLGLLKTAGVVESRREGSWVYYRLARQLDDSCRRQLRSLTKDFSKQELLREDVARLLRSRGPEACK
jgi:ArsR family transcriptional regulator